MKIKELFFGKTEYEEKPKKIWFKAKTYGYGWTPCTWQGWFALIIFVSFCIINFLRIDQLSHSGSDTLIQFVPQTLFITMLFIGFCATHGEPLKWRWGNKDKK